jgi:adenine-specific DNA glycosylase
MGTAQAGLTPLCMLKHSITRYRITLEVFRADLNGHRHRVQGDARWLTPTQLRRLPFTSAHSKILKQVAKPVRATGLTTPE